MFNQHYCTIEEAIQEIDDYDFKSMVLGVFKLNDYIPSKDSVDNINVTDLPKIIKGIILGAVDIMKKDEGALYIEIADYLYYTFYQSDLFPSVRDVSSVNIHLRNQFSEYVLNKQIPELIMLFMEQGIYPQFYSSLLINEIRNTQFYSFLNSGVTIDEIISSITFGSSDINTCTIAINVIDEIIEDILIKETEDCYDEIKELVSKSYVFKRTPSWMLDELDQVYRENEITAIFVSAFKTQDVPITFNAQAILKIVDKIFRQTTNYIINDLVTSFSAHTSEHRLELLDKFVVTNSAFQKAYDNVFEDYVGLFLNTDAIVIPDNVAEDDIKEICYKIMLKLTSYTMGYIILEFLYLLKSENIAPVTYNLIVNTIIREILCYRIYEVNPNEY